MRPIWGQANREKCRHVPKAVHFYLPLVKTFHFAFGDKVLKPPPAWSAQDALDGEFGAVVLEDACRDINMSGSLDAAWEAMTAAGVERATSADLPD